MAAPLVVVRCMSSCLRPAGIPGRAARHEPGMTPVTMSPRPPAGPDRETYPTTEDARAAEAAPRDGPVHRPGPLHRVLRVARPVEAGRLPVRRERPLGRAVPAR